MDAFDYTELPTRPKINFGKIIWNFLTVVLILATLVVGTIFLTIFINPYTSLNIYPPPTLFPTLALPTATPTPKELPPTWTPEATDTPLPSETPEMTDTPEATDTPEVTEAPDEPTPTATSLPYALQAGSPTPINSEIFHPDLGCNWMGVAGQVFSLSGDQVIGLAVELGGSLADVEIQLLSLTGAAIQYGPGGYEFTLATETIASQDTLYIRLLDQAGLPFSDKIYFSTFDDCEKNLILINFNQIQQEE